MKERFKIVGRIGDKQVTLETVNDEADAEELRRKYARSFSSSWTVSIEKVSALSMEGL